MFSAIEEKKAASQQKETLAPHQNEPPILFEALDENEIRKILDSDITSLSTAETLDREPLDKKYLDDLIKENQAILFSKRNSSNLRC